MSEEPPDRQRSLRPPEEGWTLGASGLPRAVWGGLAVVLLGLAVLLFVLQYVGYGAMIAILAGAAAVNTL